MVTDGHMNDASPLVRQDHQDEQKTVRRGRHDEEIRGHDLSDVVGQERTPRLRGWLSMADDVSCDRGLTDSDPQLD
jgi:hypothetical protein